MENRESKRSVKTFIIMFFVFQFFLPGANDYKKEYITIRAGKQYDTGKFHNLFLGKHWRKLWTTPIKVEVLDLDNFAGGLTPVKRGGGKQTKSLRFLGKDGSYWKFRSVNKDPGKVLYKEFQNTIVHSVLQDQISTANPFAPLIVVPILNAVGILQAKPRLVWLKSEKKLGQYREAFGNVLGMIELHPTDRDKGIGQFKDAKKIVNTYKLFKILEKNRNEKVDSKAFLKARLIDIFLGDWDRHSDQWRWSKYKDKKKRLWKPIPRDRDQAFAKFDGIFPALATLVVLDLTHFSKNYPRIKKISWSGRFLDQRYLAELDKKTWENITNSVKYAITDRVIEEAVKQLPPECFNKGAEALIKKLKSRRDKLNIISNKYYNLLNKLVDVFCSDLNDYVQIKRINDKSTEVSVFKRSKKKGKKRGNKKGKPLFYKIFDNSKTSEIRIFLNKGDDKAVVSGIVKKGPIIRIIGGNGKDEMIDLSKVKGKFLLISPINKIKKKTFLYDSGKKTILVKNSGTSMDYKKTPKPKNKSEKYEPLQKNRGNEIYVYPLISFNSDDGIIFGFGSFINKYGFRYIPYKYKLSLSGSYTSKTQHSAINFKGVFIDFLDGIDLHINIEKSRLLYSNYFGFGNNTKYDKDLEKEDYYKNIKDFFVINPSLHFKLFEKTAGEVGILYRKSQNDLNNNSILDDFPLGTYGIGDYNSFELNSSFKFDNRDNISNPYKGFYFKLSLAYSPDFLDNSYNYLRSDIDTRLFFTLKTISRTTFALRLGGTKIFGKYSFFNAAFLGGSKNLRGFNRYRFSGDASVFGQFELRTYLGPVFLIFPGKFGIHFFSDTGRVFLKDETSKKWHYDYGGGIWISFANRMMTTVLTFAKSDEKLAFYFSLKFMY